MDNEPGSATASATRPERETAIVVGPLTWRDVVAVAGGARVTVAAETAGRMTESRTRLLETAASGSPVYGLTTGLGHNRTATVDLAADAPAREMAVLEAHAAGVGSALPGRECRAVLAATASCLGNGGSAGPGFVQSITALLNAGVLPTIPETASVGAGDLMAMCAAGLAICGRGTAAVPPDVPMAVALEDAGIEPYVPGPHEALGIFGCNGMAYGLAALAVEAATAVMSIADVCGALSWHAIDGARGPFDPAVAAAGGDVHARIAAHHLHTLTDGATHAAPAVQDPVSFRVMPQVHGSLRDQVTRLAGAVDGGLRGRHQNPLVTESGDVLANGNFLPMALVIAVEALRLTLAHVAALAERRTAHVAGFTFGMGSLAPTAPGGIADSGAIAYSAAALVARIRQAANPISIACPPLDRDVEDHATMAPTAVALTRQALDDTLTVLAIEALVAVDATHDRSIRTFAPQIRDAVDSVRDIVRLRVPEPLYALTGKASSTLSRIAQTHP